MIDFREEIRAELERQGRTVGWLATHEDTPHEQSVYRYMRGDRDVNAETVAKLLDVLGMRLVADKRRGKRV